MSSARWCVEYNTKWRPSSQVLDSPLAEYERSPQAKAWTTFVNSVSHTFQHISFAGDYNIPLYAMKLLLTKCPKLDIIDGGFSGDCCVLSTNEIPLLTKEQADLIVFVNGFGSSDMNLEAVTTKCKEVRMLWFDWNPNMDLRLLENENMKKLIELDIRNLKTEQVCIYMGPRQFIAV